MTHYESKLDRLRAEYGKAITAYENAKRKAGDIALAHRLEELERAKRKLAEEEANMVRLWKKVD